MDSDDEGKWTSVRYDQKKHHKGGKQAGTASRQIPTGPQGEPYKASATERVVMAVRGGTNHIGTALADEILDGIPNRAMDGTQLEVILLGIGELTNGPSVLQFALGEMVRGLMERGARVDSVVWFDPITGDTEATSGLRSYIAAHKGKCAVCDKIDISSKNVHGCYTPAKDVMVEGEEKAKEGGVSSARHLVVFAPHCPRPLYHNLLVSNTTAKSISNLTLIGNDISQYFAPDSACFIEGLLDVLPPKAGGIQRTTWSHTTAATTPSTPPPATSAPTSVTATAPLHISSLEGAVCTAIGALPNLPKISKQQVKMAFSDLSLIRFQHPSIDTYTDKIPKRRRKIRVPQGDML